MLREYNIGDKAQAGPRCVPLKSSVRKRKMITLSGQEQAHIGFLFFF